ncbi:MAG: hypothetical protein AMS25_04850 [Gemmatimonas sp. SM23_52]|nr:MAG: hypothetical protein AMS25_04850 [Gemmatimonas sp. SM23_52]
MGQVDVSAPKADVTWPHAATLVLAAETPRQRRWAVGTTIEIVRKLAERRPKVVLADLQTRTPSSLAAALGTDEAPGMVDVLFRGAAFSAVASRPQSEVFYFLPIGTAPPPLQVLYQHPRWGKIATRLAQADAHFLLCVSAQDWLEAGPIAGFEACITLNASGLEVELPGQARRLVEFLAPPEIREGQAGMLELPWYAAAEPETQPMPSSARRAAHHPEMGPDVQPELGRPGAPRGRAQRQPGAGSAAWAGPTTVPAGRGRGKGRGRRGILPIAAFAAAAALLLTVYMTIGSRQVPEDPGYLEAAADTGQVTASTVSAAEREGEGARLQEETLPYSVLIASFSSYDDALARQREWTRADLPFYVAPTPVRGIVYYRVFAGMLADRERAGELMAQLVRERIKDTVRDWDVRPARLAFSFGVYSSSGEARALLETLFAQGVPAYIVPAAADDGIAYHVFAGGYERPEDARPLKEQLRRAGLDVELVERVGLVLP